MQTSRYRRILTVTFGALAAGTLTFTPTTQTSAQPPGGLVPSAPRCVVHNTHWTPARITNGRRGDAVMSTTSADGGGPAFFILRVLGQQFVHTGMLLYDYGHQIRHNTMINDPDLLRKHRNWLGVTTKLKQVDLENGRPGIITESVDRAFGLQKSAVNNVDRKIASFGFSGAVLVKPAYDSMYATHMNRAASKMEFLTGYYRVQSYSDINQLDDSNVQQAGKGNMCSGTIWHAHKFAGNPVAPAVTYSPEARLEGSKALFTFAVNAIISQESWFRLMLNAFLRQKVTLVFDISNQIVNCFALQNCGNTSSAWRTNGVGSGVSVSPDNLLPLNYENSYGNTPGVQSTTGVFGRVVPLQKAGGYYTTTTTTIPCPNNDPVIAPGDGGNGSDGNGDGGNPGHGDDPGFQ